MKWTKAHSRNAVAAKARLRIARAEAEPTLEPVANVPKPRMPKPKFRIVIEDCEHGERTQISLHRFNGKLFSNDFGLTSPTDVSRRIRCLLANLA